MAEQLAIGNDHIHQWENYLHMSSVLVRTPLEHHCKCCAECNQLMCETTVATTGAAQWYIGGGDEVAATIYDASDPDGDGPNGHGMVCESAAPSDARLIATAPVLQAIVLGFLGTLDVTGEDEAVVRTYYNQNIALFNLAIDTIKELRGE